MNKMKKNLGRIGLRLFCVLAACSLVVSPAIGALQVTDGTPDSGATIGGSTGAVVVDVTGPKAVIDWTTMDTETGELLEFLGASGFAVLNRVSGGATNYLGNLEALGGNIIIVNAEGIMFGPDSVINASKFTASTLALDENKFALGDYTFEAADLMVAGEVINEGTIHVDSQVALLAQRVINKGTIICDQGTILMATGDKIVLGTEGSNVVVEIGVGPRANYPTMDLGDVINEGPDALLESMDGDIILAAGDTFSQALSPVGVGRVEHSGEIIAAGNLEIGAVEEVVFEQGSTTSVDGAVNIKAGSGILVKEELASGGDMTLKSGGFVTTQNGFDLSSGGDMTVKSGSINAISFSNGGGAKSDGIMDLDAGTYISVDGDLVSGGDMTVATTTGAFSGGDLVADGKIDLQTDLELYGGEWVAGDAGVMKYDGQRIDAEDGAVTTTGSIKKITAGELHITGSSVQLNEVTTSGNMYISAEGDIQLDGDLDTTVSGWMPGPPPAGDEADFIYPADIGGVSVISENGKIASGGGDSLDISIYGYSDDVVDGWYYSSPYYEVGGWGPAENPGVDLPYKDDAGNAQGKAAIVLKSHDTLTLGSNAVLDATGYYLPADAYYDEGHNESRYIATGVDDRRGIDFLDEDATIGGHERDKGITSDVAIYGASTAGNVVVETTEVYVNDSMMPDSEIYDGYLAEEFYWEMGPATVVLDASDTVMLNSLKQAYQDWLKYGDNAKVDVPGFGGFRMEVASRRTEWLNQAIAWGTLEFANDPEFMKWLLGGQDYVLRGAGGSNFPPGHRAWVLEDQPPMNEVAALWVDEFPELKGCPLELESVANELGITREKLQMSIGSSLAMHPNIQACDACGQMIGAATVLKDFDGAYLAAMNKVFGQLAPANAPFTEETAAMIVVAFGELSDQDSNYALASAYIDAFVDYVAALDELGSPVGDPVTYAMKKHGKALNNSPNKNISSFIAKRLEESVN